LFESVAATRGIREVDPPLVRNWSHISQYFLPVLNGLRRADTSESRANAVKPLMVVASKGATGDLVG
jgi:hypothetical protein